MNSTSTTLAPPRRSAARPGPRPVEEPRRRPRVLVVEDQVDLAWLERFTLEAEGYEVEVALEGRSAIVALEAFDPELVLLDLMLPNVDGWEVLARAREMFGEGQPKVILVSALVGELDETKLGSRSVHSYLAKPFDVDELVRLVGRTLAA